MKYLDSGSRDPRQTLATWLEEVVRPDVTEFRLQTGFFSYDGICLLVPYLEISAREDRILKALIGSNDGGTLRADIAELVGILGLPRQQAQLGIVNFAGGYFHPKSYHVVRADGSQAAFVGSANLTAAGLALHIEAGISLDTRDGDSPERLVEIGAAIDRWFAALDPGLIVVTGMDTVDELLTAGILSATPAVRASRESTEGVSSTAAARPRIRAIFPLPPSRPRGFGNVAGVLVPAVGAEVEDLPEEAINEDQSELVVELAPPAPRQSGAHTVFLMTLQRTDVGVGQTTLGAARRSPEIFIPLAARNADPEFWGWPGSFTPDTSKPGKMDRGSVKMRIGTTIVEVNMMTWPDKHDFRLRSEQLRSAGNIGDILYLERSDGLSGFTYYVEVIPAGSAKYPQHLAYCVNAVRNSKRVWGYL